MASSGQNCASCSDFTSDADAKSTGSRPIERDDAHSGLQAIEQSITSVIGFFIAMSVIIRGAGMSPGTSVWAAPVRSAARIGVVALFEIEGAFLENLLAG